MFQAGTGTPGLCPRPPQPPAKPTIIPPQPISSQRPSAPAGGIAHVTSKVPWADTAVTDGSVSPPPSAMLSSVAKVVQPTATVSSVPVCGPSEWAFFEDFESFYFSQKLIVFLFFFQLQASPAQFLQVRVCVALFTHRARFQARDRPYLEILPGPLKVFQSLLILHRYIS